MAGRTFLKPMAAVLRTPQRIFRESGDFGIAAGEAACEAFSSAGFITVSHE
jgi:hypothetical protein